MLRTGTLRVGRSALSLLGTQSGKQPTCPQPRQCTLSATVSTAIETLRRNSWSQQVAGSPIEYKHERLVIREPLNTRIRAQIPIPQAQDGFLTEHAHQIRVEVLPSKRHSIPPEETMDTCVVTLVDHPAMGLSHGHIDRQI